jgi:predicted phosphodiesterase
MASTNPLGREVVLELLRKFPNTPTLTLAKKAYKENGKLFKNLEACRSSFRTFRGAHGNPKRDRVKVKDHMREPHKAGEHFFPRLPGTLDGADGWKEYAVDTPGAWGIISDLHIPYHSLPAIRAALKEGKRRGWKGIIINGDLFDMPGGFSKFDHDPRKSNFARDLYMGRQFFDTLKHEFPRARKIFKFGNHDLHYSRYLWGKCPELLDVEATWLENLIECDRYGIEVVKDNQVIKLGKLDVAHGHEFGNGATSPISPAKTLYDRIKRSGLCGHYHRTSQHEAHAPTSGESWATYSIGCLCGLHPQYLRYNQWGHGAATAEISRDGAFDVHNFRLRHGKPWG